MYENWEDAVQAMKEMTPAECVGEYRVWDVSQEIQ